MKTLLHTLLNKLMIIASVAALMTVTTSSALAATAAPQATTTTNSAWSGHVASGYTFTKVQGTFKVPTITCTAADTVGTNYARSLFWVGFDGYVSKTTVEQIGVTAWCGPGPQAYYYAWTEMYPTNPSTVQVNSSVMSVNPGNNVTISAAYVAASKQYKLTINNHTTGKYWTRTATCGPKLTCARTSADWIAERIVSKGTELQPTAFYPLANWRTMSFTGATAATNNSLTLLPASSYKNTILNMTGGGHSLAIASGLTGGQNFTETWQNRN